MALDEKEYLFIEVSEIPVLEFANTPIEVISIA